MTVAVVGSINQDLVVRVPRHPVPGETVLGTGHFTAAGGKGANQAVAAARLDRAVAMVGRVGDDAAGRALRSGLAAEGVDVEHVAIDDGAGSGLAVITLDAAGENAIVVSPGANGRLAPEDIDRAAFTLSDAAVTLVQLEIPLEAVAAAVAAASGMVVLNPAPARPLPREVLDAVDVLVPNRTELATLAGVAEPASIDEVQDALTALDHAGPVVVTLGAAGALVAEHGSLTHVAAPTITPVDTTAAGDAFCGALADGLAGGQALHAAVQFAVHAGAAAATRMGAQPSLPTREDVVALMPQ